MGEDRRLQHPWIVATHDDRAVSPKRNQFENGNTAYEYLFRTVLREHPELNLGFSISCTSRAPRGTEKNGVEYFFLTAEEFREKISRDEFWNTRRFIKIVFMAL